MALNQDHATLPKTPFSRTCVLTTAETAFNAPTAIVDLLLAADNTDGARITKVYAIPRANIATASNIQLYKRSGSTYTLIDSALMATVSPAAAVANPKTDFGYSVTSPLELEAGIGLAMATGQSVANGIVGRCEGGFYAQ
jgi:hypothetical protein